MCHTEPIPRNWKGSRYIGTVINLFQDDNCLRQAERVMTSSGGGTIGDTNPPETGLKQVAAKIASSKTGAIVQSGLQLNRSDKGISKEGRNGDIGLDAVLCLLNDGWQIGEQRRKYEFQKEVKLN